MSDNQPNHELPNHELNDELLSAYLDGELSDAERAAVEVRLASDPEAQHLLHQLRSVSEAVQAMPLKTAGRNLHDQILQKVANVKPADRPTAAIDSAPAVSQEKPWLPGDTLPRVTAFQTRRSWVWASLVVAAGLLIMVLQPGKEADKDLPAVAQNGNNRQAKEAGETFADRSISAPPQSAVATSKAAPTDSTSSVSGVAMPEAPAAPSAPAAAERAPTGAIASADQAARGREPLASAPAAAPSIDVNGQLRDTKSEAAFQGGTVGGAAPTAAPAIGTRFDEPGILAGSPGTPAPSSRNSTLNADDEAKVATGGLGSPAAAPEKLAASRMAGPGGVQGGGGGFGGGENSSMPASGRASREQQPAVRVVHVVAKQDAIQSKAFDRLLARNGIELASESPATARAGGESEPAASRLDKSAPEADEDRDVEVVLVEAPPAAIMSFMSELNKDSDNYVGVEVDDSPEPADRSGNKGDLGQKITADLNQYSRGIVSAPQKDAFRNRYYLYSDAGGNKLAADFDTKQDVASGRQLKPAEEAASRASDSGATQDQQKSFAVTGRARRVESWEMKVDREGQNAPTDGATRSQGQASFKLRRAESVDKTPVAPADAENANWQVLFVLSPDHEESTTAPASAAPALKATK